VCTGYTISVKAGKVVRIITARGGVILRQRGSHRFFEIERDGVKAHTTISNKDGEDIPTGLLAKIERDLAPVLGRKWLS